MRLTGQDEFFTHQIPFTHDVVSVSDPDWRERIWLSVVDTVNKDVVVSAGFGHYPNGNVQEAFAAVRFDNVQMNVRASRHLRPSLHEMQVGPLRIEVLEPLERYRLVLEENPSGVTLDIELRSSLRPHVEDPHLEVTRGRIVHNLVRYYQIVRASGTVEVPGRRWDLRPEEWYGARDHSWGVQPHFRGKTPAGGGAYFPTSGGLFSLTPFQFDDWGAFYYLMESRPHVPLYLTGSVLHRHDDPEDDDRIVAVEHELRFLKDSPSQHIETGELLFHLASGKELEVSLVGHRPRVFLRGGLYGGWNGWYQGDDKGEEYFEHDVWDHDDAEAVRDRYSTARGGGDHLIEYRCGDQVGFGIMEYMVLPGYPKYPEVQ